MAKEDIKIRKAIEQDYKAVNVLYYETYNFYHQNIPKTYKKTLKNILPKGTFLNMIEDKKGLALVAEGDCGVVGVLYATIEKENGDEVTRGYHRVSIDELSVGSAYTNRGIGSMLMQEVEKWTEKKKIKDLTVLVYAFNEKAIKFYENNGYRPYSIKLDKKI